MKNLTTFVVFLLLSMELVASHYRAGEIIFSRVNDTNPFLFEITVITYTKTGGASNQADDCFITVQFGDGTEAQVDRVNGPLGDCDDARMGEPVASNIKVNRYTTQHEFPGPGTYEVSMFDQNRNGDILNIPNPSQVPFYIESSITIDVNTGGNNAPVLLNPPIDNGCAGKIYEHNPGAFDPDGDSLVYSLMPSLTANGLAIPGYQFPNEISPSGNNNLSIDPLTGTLTWDSPQQLGEYNVAIQIKEYRRNTNSGQVIEVGRIIRDLQITIGACDFEPPVINDLSRTCIAAGDMLMRDILVSDPDFDEVELSVAGEAVNTGSAYLVPENPIDITPFSAQFFWNTECGDVRATDHWFYFKAKETRSSNQGLVDFEELAVKVVAPEVVISSVEPASRASALEINWTPASCFNAIGYDVYRYTDSLGFAPRNCNLDVPDGYEFVANVNDALTTSFIDDNNGQGLVYGRKYCYIIVSLYEDGSQSYPSLEHCGELIKNIPILNKVSVGFTDIENGHDTISWFKPIELDRSQTPPPYAYSLSMAEVGSQDFEEVYRSRTVFDPLILDSTVVIEGLNTLEKQYVFKIDLLSGTFLESQGAAQNASSVFLRSIPDDNQLTLIWDEEVPWQNSFHLVYQVEDVSHPLDSLVFLDTAFQGRYVHRGLVNLVEYSYLVVSNGRYSSSAFSGDLVNYSQVHTGIPEDRTAPCAPLLVETVGDCDLSSVNVVWENPNNFCDSTDDVVGYNIYFSPVLGNDPALLLTIDNQDITEYYQEDLLSIAGCYAITAIDSFGNESAFSEAICIDNCPLYELPNIFTPGTDNINDLFVPFPYRYVESIDLIIFNRWGREVFRTTNPQVNWDGRDQSSGDLLPEGVYYYVCLVNEVRLTGIEPREIRGYVQIIGDLNAPPFTE